MAEMLQGEFFRAMTTTRHGSSEVGDTMRKNGGRVIAYMVIVRTG